MAWLGAHAAGQGCRASEERVAEGGGATPQNGEQVQVARAGGDFVGRGALLAGFSMGLIRWAAGLVEAPTKRVVLGSLALTGLLLLSGCFGGGAAQPTAAPTSAPAPAAASPPTAKPSAAPSPSAAAKPAATAAPAAVDRVWVGNTDGEGVYIRRTPAMADRERAFPDRTVLLIIGDDVDAEGVKWRHVRAPDGLEGYVPAQYTVTTEP